MSFVVYLFVLLIAAGSVLFGLDWVSAPMSPMPASKYELHAAKEPQPALKQGAETAGKANPAVPVNPTASVTTAIASSAVEPAPAPISVPEPAVAAAPTPKCDINACAAAYRSFTVIDCTYQPTDGPRRLCTRGRPPAAAAAAQATPQAPAVPDARAQAACNIAACAQTYFSFNASDCTYQPLDGPRRLCEK